MSSIYAWRACLRRIGRNRKAPELLEAHSSDGWTPLHLAAFFGWAELANALHGQGAKVDSRSTNSMKNTPLHAAAAGGSNVPLVDLLLKRGAQSERHARRWLDGACMPPRNRAIGAMAETLLANGADVNQRADNNQSPLDMALLKGHQESGRTSRTTGSQAAVSGPCRHARNTSWKNCAALRWRRSPRPVRSIRWKKRAWKRSAAKARSRRSAKISASFPRKSARRLGKLLNSVKQDLEAEYAAKKERFEKAALAEQLAGEWIDVTLPAAGVRPGSLHPITQIQAEIEDLFTSWASRFYTGPKSKPKSTISTR